MRRALQCGKTNPINLLLAFLSLSQSLQVVLSACSPYFRKLLKANPCEHPIVILRDVRSEDIENLLR